MDFPGLKCDKCKVYIDKNSKFCSNCGNPVNQHRLSSFFYSLITVIFFTILIVLGTVSAIWSKNVFVVIIWLLFIVFIVKTIVLNLLIYHFTDYRNPNIKLLNKLFTFNILSDDDILTIEYIRQVKGWKSLLNNGEGLILVCENGCQPKNEIQQNFLNEINKQKAGDPE